MHDVKKQAEAGAIVTVDQVKETARVWWLRIIGTVRTKTEQGVSQEEIAKYVETEKAALCVHLDEAVKKTGDKKVAEQLAVAVEQSKVIVTEQATEVHAVIVSGDKHAAVEKLQAIEKVSEERIKVAVVAEKKP